MVRENPEVGEVCDIVASLKKAEDLAKDTKTELLQAREKFEQVACALYVRAGDLGEPIRTDWVTGSPSSKSIPRLPTYKKSPEEYVALCKFFGMSDDVISSDAFRPHFPGIVEVVTACENAGKPLPPGISKDSLTTVFVVSCRWKTGVDIDQLC